MQKSEMASKLFEKFLNWQRSNNQCSSAYDHVTMFTEKFLNMKN